MRRKKNIFKIILSCLILCISATVVCGATYYFSITFSTTLDKNKIEKASASNIDFLDKNLDVIPLSELSSSQTFVNYNQLQQHTIDAFLCVEDKRFFSHNGVDYIRILGALKNNLFNPDKKQGGSTISQQVIKNTQLGSEKTIDRKLKEIKLAKQLEKNYSKQEILEIYLNSIYFGNGCYGIENASKYYFNKQAKDLSLSESAMLASTINAPSIYDPVSHFDSANKRKNLILKLMKDNEKISISEYEESINDTLSIAKNRTNYQNQYYKGVINEACKILNVTESQLKNIDVQIGTYYDSDIQQQLQNLITSEKYTNFSSSAKIGAIVLNNTQKSVVAFASNNGLDLLKTYRQPGSVIKPILVYAPAFEYGKFSPASIICDEPLNINGYQPENANKSYLGNVNVKTCIAKSLNIPAVKILSEVGINKARTYANSLGINFEKNDNNLALALGGFTKGTTIKQLSDAYMCFANGGEFVPSSFVSTITQNNKPIYKRQIYARYPVKDSVAYLVSDCLKECVNSGTAKRMNSLNIPLCAKTGTVGSSTGNSDAYNICYTTQHTLCCWIGSNTTSSPLPSSANGSTYPTIFNSQILKSLYQNSSPADFKIPDSISRIYLNQDALKEGKLEMDNTSSYSEFFDNRYIPTPTQRTQLDVQLTVNNLGFSKPNLQFLAKRDVVYYIYRKFNNEQELLNKIEFFDGIVNYTDQTAITSNIYEYFIVASKNGQSNTSNYIKLIAN